MNVDLSPQPDINPSSRRHSPASNNLEKLFFGMLFSFYLALSLVRFVWPAQLLTSFVLSTAGLLALALLSTRIQKDHFKIYAFIGAVIFSFLISSLFVGRTERIGHVVLFVLVNAGMALVLVKGYVSRLSAYLVFYGLSSYFIFLIFAGTSARDALTATSYNGISMMMLAACVSLYVVLGTGRTKIDLKPAVLTLLICTWAIGRSGILSSLFLLLGLLVLNLQARAKNRYIYAFSVTALLFLGYWFFDNMSSLAEDNLVLEGAVGNYSARNAEEGSPRLIMWANYFNNLDFFRVIFGANIFTDPWSDGLDFGYNYHSSWISLHSQTGLMGLVIFTLMLCALYRYWKSNRLFFVLFFTVIIRWSTDTGIFFESWDFLVYFFIFYYWAGKASAPVPLKSATSSNHASSTAD